MEFVRLEDETEEELIYRVCSYKDTIGTWKDVCGILNKLLGYQYDESCYRKKYQSFMTLMEHNQDKFSDFKNFQDEVNKIKFDLTVERKKVQRVNREYYENARCQADNELYIDMCKEAILNQTPINVIPTTQSMVQPKNCGLLLIADAHYGKEFTLHGLGEEIVNEYSPIIYQQRMWKLLSDIENDFSNNKVDKLIINDLGDCIENILRLGTSVKKLHTGVVDSIEEYAQFMATWLCEVYNRLHIPIEYSLVGGNHDVLRILQQKPSFAEENIAKNILSNISLRIDKAKLQAIINDNQRVDITVNQYSDIIYNNIFGTNVVCHHGNFKNIHDTLSFFENYYNIDIDIFITGHYHTSTSETIGFGYYGDKEIMRVPSIVGADDYAKSINKCSRAGAKYIIFTDGIGKDWEKTYYLN